MAKKVSTKKRQTPEIEVIPSVLEHFGIDEPEEKEKPEPKKDADIDALVARLDRLETDNKTLQQSNLALMSSPLPATPIVAPVYQPAVKDLPDPVTEPELYAAEIERRVEDKITSRNAEATQVRQKEDETNSRINALWDQFADDARYDDYSEFPDRVSFAAEKVAQRAGKKGLDLDKYMFVTTEQFFSDVVVEMNKIFPKVEPVDNSEDKTSEDQGEAERTGGIFGGLETGTRSSDDNTKEKGDLITDLMALQKKSEFF